MRIGEARWLMLRRLQARPGGRGRFEDVREMKRMGGERKTVRVLLALKLIKEVPGDVEWQYEITPAGKRAAEFGELEGISWEEFMAAEKAARKEPECSSPSAGSGSRGRPKGSPSKVMGGRARTATPSKPASR